MVRVAGSTLGLFVVKYCLIKPVELGRGQGRRRDGPGGPVGKRAPRRRLSLGLAVFLAGGFLGGVPLPGLARRRLAWLLRPADGCAGLPAVFAASSWAGSNDITTDEDARKIAAANTTTKARITRRSRIQREPRRSGARWSWAKTSKLDANASNAQF